MDRISPYQKEKEMACYLISFHCFHPPTPSYVQVAVSGWSLPPTYTHTPPPHTHTSSPPLPKQTNNNNNNKKEEESESLSRAMECHTDNQCDSVVLFVKKRKSNTSY